MKYLLNAGAARGRMIADHLRLPFRPIHELLSRLKQARLVVYANAAPLHDYLYELSELGLERARRYNVESTYFGAAPAPLDLYSHAVMQQRLSRETPNLGAVCRALSDLTLTQEAIVRIGQALHSGRGMFLYGPPGNGKSSIAERVMAAYDEAIWIPRTLTIWGEIVRLFDPGVHQEAPPSEEEVAERGPWDRRWVRIARPTVIAGGEFTLENLELAHNPATGVAEAPLHLKSNCGALVIDDFGRQRVDPAALLNRWIVPLEKRCDYLNLPSGAKVEVPFEQFVVFSTNLKPGELVDEAFTRRIPYKVAVQDPTPEQFRRLFASLAEERGVELADGVLDELLAQYRRAGRQLRFCHPRDLLEQIVTICSLQGHPPVANRTTLEPAIANYFGQW